VNKNGGFEKAKEKGGITNFSYRCSVGTSLLFFWQLLSMNIERKARSGMDHLRSNYSCGAYNFFMAYAFFTEHYIRTKKVEKNRGLF
jgi:hypothetical protein